MGITEERHTRHVTEWRAKFDNYRKAWPLYLYRHEPIKNAVTVLRSGYLLSRASAEQNGVLTQDIAPDAIIGTRGAAHDRARAAGRRHAGGGRGGAPAAGAGAHDRVGLKPDGPPSDNGLMTPPPLPAPRR